MAETNVADSRWLILQRKLAEHRIAEIFKILRQAEIEPILIKGWAAGLKYPNPWERYFSDIDIAVSPFDYPSALEIASSIDSEIDLHEGMRHHDTIAWDNLLENSVLTAVGDSVFRILREEDHLRILCVHWLTDGGAFKEKLLDIFYAVQNRSVNFDWERCLNVVSKRRRKWIVYTIGLAHEFYGLNLDDLPFADEARRVPAWVLHALEKEWKSGLRLLPLDACLSDKKMLWRQIVKRFPPNPVQATIEMEGDFDNRQRFIYQIGSIIKRMSPSFKRIVANYAKKIPRN